jgi:hypothetical protein
MSSIAVRVTTAVLIAAIVVGAAGCATRSIRGVLADPSRYRDREVQVEGDVMDSYALLGRGVYRVSDRSGQLWVLSDRGVPRTGARVKVRGTIREAFSLGPLGAALPAAVGAGVIMVEGSHDVR